MNLLLLRTVERDFAWWDLARATEKAERPEETRRKQPMCPHAVAPPSWSNMAAVSSLSSDAQLGDWLGSSVLSLWTPPDFSPTRRLIACLSASLVPVGFSGITFSHHPLLWAFYPKNNRSRGHGLSRSSPVSSSWTMCENCAELVEVLNESKCVSTGSSVAVSPAAAGWEHVSMVASWV